MWQKSSFSEGGTEACVEISAGPAGTSYLRESDAPTEIIATDSAVLLSLMRVVREGRFDGPMP
ncbi:DUF397 domain-containing protein [Streptomyces sp. NPDC003077]|uniref:DUF397 domain-containing protein n=1 Tax=Streptomyces sp. NPDC003077 TaxID=3154443 RepID=UPI0033A657B8